MFLLSEITSLFELSRYLNRSLGSVKVLSQKVKSPTVSQKQTSLTFLIVTSRNVIVF